MRPARARRTAPASAEFAGAASGLISLGPVTGILAENLGGPHRALADGLRAASIWLPKRAFACTHAGFKRWFRLRSHAPLLQPR